MLFLLLAGFLTTAHAQECEDSQRAARPDQAILQQAPPILQVAQAVTDTLVTIKVNHGGAGRLSFALNAQGVPQALMMYYDDPNDDKAPISSTIPVADLEAGRELKLKGLDGKPSPLILKLTPGQKVVEGGEALLEIVTDFDPLKKITYPLRLARNAATDWGIHYQGRPVSNVTLSPGISWLSWAGTFTKAEFQ